MSRRPEGTDGSDHGYRMVVEERYEKMALYRTLSKRLLPLHVLVIAVQFAWLASPVSIGYSVNAFVYAFVVAEMVALILWTYAQPGTPRESTLLLKAYSTALLVIAAVVWGTTCGYFIVTDVKLRVPSLMAAAVASKFGLETDAALRGLEAFEGVFRVALLGITTASAFFTNALVQLKMHQRKQEQLRAKKD